MEGPGMSLFQGAPSIHINNSAQDRLEEQEEIENQKRLNEELKHNLVNAFDDLHDDEENSSVNSSGNYTLDATRSNGAQHPIRSGLPPTYVESLNHLKEIQHSEPSKPYCETPKNHFQHLHSQEDAVKLQYSPYGAGDGQNHYFAQDFRGHLNGINNYEARQEYMNTEQLKVMYEMRVKECQQFAVQIEKLDGEIEELRARLAAALRDRDQAELSAKEAQHLLASSKRTSLELEQRVAALTERVAEGERDKEQLRLELRAADLALQQLQQRQVAHSHDADALFREQQDRHREEMDRLHNDLIKAKSRLDEKDNEIKALEKRCAERDREKEQLLVEKGATINRLAAELEGAQARLGGGRDKLQQLTAERSAARDQLKELGATLEATARELASSRARAAAAQRDAQAWRAALQQLLAEALPAAPGAPADAGAEAPPSPARVSALKEALGRLRQQAQRLKDDLAERDERLEQHRKREAELRAQLEERRGVEEQLGSRAALLQRKLDLLAPDDPQPLDSYRHGLELARKEADELRAELKRCELRCTELEMQQQQREERGGRAAAANAELLQELERCSQQLQGALRDNGELKTLYLQVCSARDSVSRELKDAKSEAERESEQSRERERDFAERLEGEKRRAERASAELESAREELERANERISELQKEFTDKQREFTDKLNKFLEDEKAAMRKEAETCARCDARLKHVRALEERLGKLAAKLAAQESNETLMRELKGKGEFFMQYIVERHKKLSERRSVASGPDDRREDEPAPGAPADALAAKTALMMKEKAIRDQIAEKFTLEIKTIEMNCARRLKEMETAQLAAATTLKELLERKAREIDALKEFILSERDKVTQILESKEREISALVEEHDRLQAECQGAKDQIAEWRRRTEKYKERLSRVGSLEDLLKEKEDLKQKTSSSAKECQALRAKVTELQASLERVERKFDTLRADHQTLQDKYKNAKRTVLTYKDYMAKKDAHVSKEVSRIQDEYRQMFVTLQEQLERCARRRRGAPTPEPAPGPAPSAYAERINELSEEFGRLARAEGAPPAPAPAPP